MLNIIFQWRLFVRVEECYSNLNVKGFSKWRACGRPSDANGNEWRRYVIWIAIVNKLNQFILWIPYCYLLPVELFKHVLDSIPFDPIRFHREPLVEGQPKVALKWYITSQKSFFNDEPISQSHNRRSVPIQSIFETKYQIYQRWK